MILSVIYCEKMKFVALFVFERTMVTLYEYIGNTPCTCTFSKCVNRVLLKDDDYKNV